MIPATAITGPRRGRRDVASARLIDPLTGPRAGSLYAEEASPIYDALVAELGVPGLLAGPGPVVAGVVEAPTLSLPLRAVAS